MRGRLRAVRFHRYFGRWCGSNGSADGLDSASCANEASVRTWRRKPPAARTARGGLRTRLHCTLLYPTPTLLSSDFRLWSYGFSLIRRTAVCGPACTVVWQGRRGDPSPYADCCRLRRTIAGNADVPSDLRLFNPLTQVRHD